MLLGALSPPGVGKPHRLHAGCWRVSPGCHACSWISGPRALCPLWVEGSLCVVRLAFGCARACVCACVCVCVCVCGRVCSVCVGVACLRARLWHTRVAIQAQGPLGPPSAGDSATARCLVSGRPPRPRPRGDANGRMDVLRACLQASGQSQTL